MRLYLDACSIIYAIEGLPPFRDAVLARISQMETTPDGVLITSRLSRLECRVKPLRDRQTELLAHFEGFFARSRVMVAEVSAAVVERVTELRAEHRIKTPDALHLATAIEERADLFLTGDADLARCPGLRVEVI